MHRDDVPLSLRCSEDFDAMEGSGAVRRCDQCACSVVDLSAHTELSARLMLATAAAPCVRYAVDRDGRVRFQPSLLARAGALLMTLAPLTALAEDLSAPPPAEEAAPVGPGLIAIRVTDMDGLPIPNVTMACGEGVAVTSDAQGRALVDVGPDGCAVDIERPGFVPVRLVVPAGHDGPEVMMTLHADPSDEVYFVGVPRHRSLFGFLRHRR